MSSDYRVCGLNDSGTLHTIVLVQDMCTISIANNTNIIKITTKVKQAMTFITRIKILQSTTSISIRFISSLRWSSICFRTSSSPRLDPILWGRISNG